MPISKKKNDSSPATPCVFHPPSVPVRGRPKDLEKRQAILTAARRMFLDCGYDGVAMDAIAEASGVSKRTIYSHFADKDSLFEAAVLRGEGLLSQPTMAAPSFESLDAFCAGLVDIGVGLISFLSLPELHDLGRLTIAESRKHPEIARRFMEGPESMHKWMGTLLSKAESEKLFQLHDDAEVVADQLISMWLGIHHLRQQMGVAPPRTAEQIRFHVERCVEFFCRSLK